MDLDLLFINNSLLTTEQFLQLQGGTPRCFSISDKEDSPCNLNILPWIKCLITTGHFLLPGNISFFFPFCFFCQLKYMQTLKQNSTWISSTSSHLPYRKEKITKLYSCKKAGSRDLPLVWTIEVQNGWGIARVLGQGSSPPVCLPSPSSC